MTVAPTRTTPLCDLSARALSLGDGEIADLVESPSISAALAESWAALRGAVEAEGVPAMIDRARADAWSPAMSWFDARVFSLVEEAHVAVAFRTLICRHGFEQSHYDAMTGARRILTGPVHATDTTWRPLSRPPLCWPVRRTCCARSRSRRRLARTRGSAGRLPTPLTQLACRPRHALSLGCARRS